ncbi:cadherin domain protein, partial [Opisthorchis viverrini]
GTAQRQFHLDTSSGRFSLKSKLDREKQSRYAFKVYATDRGIPKLSCVSAVIVRVLDINDNAPKFVYPTQKNHTIYASVYTSPGVPLVKLTAVDPDEGQNAQLSFFLDDTTEHAEIFVLDENSGELSLAATNEPEKLEGKYSLVLRVQDAGIPSLSCTANINIVLNRNAKLFGPHSVQPSLVGKQLQLDSFGKDQSSRQARFESSISSSSAYQETNAKGRNMRERTPDVSGKWDPQTVRYVANDAYGKPEDGKGDAAQPFNYLSSEKALVAVICLIVLSALVAFVFLIAITLIRRKASALHLRNIPASGAAVSAAGMPRINARIANTYNSKARQLSCTSDKTITSTEQGSHWFDEHFRQNFEQQWWVESRITCVFSLVIDKYSCNRSFNQHDWMFEVNTATN